MFCSPPGSSLHGTLQARILEWVAIPFSRVSSWPSDQTCVSCMAGSFFTILSTREAQKSAMEVFPTPNEHHLTGSTIAEDTQLPGPWPTNTWLLSLRTLKTGNSKWLTAEYNRFIFCLVSVSPREVLEKLWSWEIIGSQTRSWGKQDHLREGRSQTKNRRTEHQKAWRTAVSSSLLGLAFLICKRAMGQMGAPLKQGASKLLNKGVTAAWGLRELCLGLVHRLVTGEASKPARLASQMCRHQIWVKGQHSGAENEVVPAAKERLLLLPVHWSEELPSQLSLCTSRTLTDLLRMPPPLPGPNSL